MIDLCNKMDVRIPRIVMQTSDDHNVPFKWINSPSSIREYMPGWKYVYLTKDKYRDFVIKYFPDYLFFYDSLPYDIQKTNIICFMWMYKVGGVYMSLNYEVVKTLDSLFNNGHEGVYFVPSAKDSKWYTNSFLAARPQCPIFLECLEEMKKITPWWCLDRRSKILYSTGSGMLSRVIKNTKTPFNVISSYDIPACSVCENVCDSPNAYIRKIADDSWDEWDTYFYNVFYCNWKKLVALIITIIVISYVYYIYNQPKREIYIKKKSKKKRHINIDGWKLKTEEL